MADILFRFLLWVHRQAAAVIAFWVAAACLSTAVVFFLWQAPPETRVVDEATPATRMLVAHDRLFPNIGNLAVLQIAGRTPAAVARAREEIMFELASKDSVFVQVFNPGSGAYYDRFGVYHLSHEALANRVEYARALRPLLNVVASSRSLDGLARLLEQLLEAGGLEQSALVYADLLERLSHAANGVQASRPQAIDWVSFSGLGFANDQKIAHILAWPRVGQNTIAANLLEEVAGRSFADVSVTLQSAPQPAAPNSPSPGAARISAFVAITIIFALLCLVMLAGDVGFAVLTGASWATVNAIWLAAISVGPGLDVANLPVLASASVFSLAMLVHANVALAYAALTEPGSDGYLDIYGSQELPARALSGCVFLAVLTGFTVTGSTLLRYTFLIVALLVLLSWLVCTTLLPALFRFIDDRAHARFLTAQIRRDIGKPVLLVVSLTAVLAIFALMPSVVRKPPTPAVSASSVTILTNSAEDAKAMHQRVTAMPQVKSARWLGTFLPAEDDQKQQAISTLEFQLPNPEPPTAPENMDRLVAVLDKISAASVSPELKGAAIEAVNALRALALTGKSEDLARLQSDVFSGLDLLEERARQLSRLSPPALPDLDRMLSRMFMADPETYRVEVEPAEGISPVTLALALEAAGMTPVSQYLADRDWQQAVDRLAFVVLGLGLLAGLAMIFPARRVVGSAARSAAVIASAAGLVMLAFLAWRLSPTPQATIMAAALLALISAMAAEGPVTERLRLRPVLGASSREELIWLVPLMMLGAAVAAVLLGLENLSQIFAVAAAISLGTSALNAALSARG